MNIWDKLSRKFHLGKRNKVSDIAVSQLILFKQLHLSSSYSGKLVLDGMGSLAPELKEGLFGAEAEKRWWQQEAFRIEIMLNPNRNPQWALYKAIEDGAIDDMRRALDVGADPNRLQNGQPFLGAALAHQCRNEVFCIEKATLLLERGCSLQLEGDRNLLRQLARDGVFWEEDDDEGAMDTEAVKLAAFLYEKGAPDSEDDQEDADFAEFMTMVQEQVLRNRTAAVARVVQARRL